MGPLIVRRGGRGAVAAVLLLTGACSNTDSSGLIVGSGPGLPDGPDAGPASDTEEDAGTLADAPSLPIEAPPASLPADAATVAPDAAAVAPDAAAVAPDAAAVPPDAAVDLTPPCVANACGGCVPLARPPGAACGACGTLRCAGADTVTCNDPGANGCGGCKPLPAAPGSPCGVCGRLQCDGRDAVTCADRICSGVTPLCRDGACVECLPPSRRCSSPTQIEVCSPAGAWIAGAVCLPGACHGSGSEASCLSVAVTAPADAATVTLLPPPSFRWSVGGRLPAVRTCNVLLLDKGGSPRDGFGEEAFYVGEASEHAPPLEPLFYAGARVAWAVLTVACRSPAATCQPCDSPRDCAARGVLAHLPCDGVAVWSDQRSFTGAQ
jgi:hypothetical protein